MKQWLRAALIGAVIFGAVALAQQGPAGFGGGHQMADLFKVFFTWSGVNITIANNGSLTVTVASGSNGISFTTNGERFDLGGGTNDYLASDGTNIIVGTAPGAGYIASAIPVSIGSVYINNTIAAFTYGGGTLPAHPSTVTDIAFNIRTIGSGGTTNNTFQISDGTNTCNCTFACNASAGSKIASCANGAGTGCVYAASAALIFGFSAVGDCTIPTDILGNLEVRGKWQ